MATSPTDPRPGQGTPDWLQALTRHRKETAYALLGVAAAAAGAGVYAGIKNGWSGETPFVWLWCFALAVIALGAGLVQLLREPTTLASETDYGRMFVLLVGGLVGLVTAALGVGLIWQWWTAVSGGWKAWQGDEGWRVWVILLALVGGLVIMFASLQLARTETRSSVLLRRLLYGYNAVLTGLLLLGVLFVLNVLTYLPVQPFAAFGKSYDWTSQSIYSLSSKSENILKSVDRPVKAYVILRTNEPIFPMVRGLMENFQAATDYFQVEYLSPDKNQQRVAELAREYKFGDQRGGVLVVYGSGSSATSQFIKPSELVEGAPGPQGRPQAFNGESALITAINFMMENKVKPVIYFTQGNGEPGLSDPGPGGAAELKQRLERRGFYTVKGLEFVPDEAGKSEKMDVVVSNRVPEDATVVVLGGPRKPLPPYALAALRQYMNPAAAKADQKKGKLVVLQGAVPNPKERSAMLDLGVNGVLADFGVRVADEVVLHDFRVDRRTPELVFVETPSDESLRGRNAVVAAFADQGFRMLLARPVQADAARNPRYTSDVILEVPTRARPFTQTNLEQTDVEYVAALIQQNELAKRLSKQPVPVAVAVSEDTSTAPPDQFHAAIRDRKQTPRLVVFGDANWMVNAGMEQGGSFGPYYDLFASTLAWLRERPASVGIEPKKSDVFTWKDTTNVTRMVVIPLVLSVFGIIGLGTGIWVVRRR